MEANEQIVLGCVLIESRKNEDGEHGHWIVERVYIERGLKEYGSFQIVSDDEVKWYRPAWESFAGIMGVLR